MSGLFAWLNDALGGTNMGTMPPTMMDPSGGGGQPPMQPPMPPNPMVAATNRYQSPGSGPQPMPPVPPGMDHPQLSPEAGMASGPPPGTMYPPGGDPMQSGGLNPGGVPAPPMPAPRPPGANGMPPAPPPQSAGGPAVQPTPPPVVMGAGPDMTGQRAQARSILGRAIGLDQNQESSLRGSLGAGLKAAGENANKGKGAAFMGSAGAAIEGGKNADDKTTDQQDKVLGRAIQSKASDVAAANSSANLRLAEARTKLTEEQTKMARAGGKDSVMNSQQQLYLRGMGLVNNDPEVKLAKSAYEAALKVGDANSPEVKAAKKAHEELVAAKTKAHLEALGVDPKIADKLRKQPGMSQESPIDIKGYTQEKLNALPPGSYIRAPDGKVLQKKAPAAAAGGANQPAPAQGMAPNVQPPLPPAVANARAYAGADDEED